MLIDNWGRKIDYLRVSITDKCNLRCRYCMPEEGIPHLSHEKVLRVEEMTRIVGIVAKEGVDHIRITGGEPLVHKGIFSFIASLRDIGLTDLSLTTNGILLEQMAAKLKQAGIDRVNISLDTMDAERFSWITRGGDVQAVLRGVEAAMAAGLEPVKLNMVVVKSLNDNEVVGLSEMAKDKPLHIRFIELMPVGTDGIWSKENFVATADTMAKIEQAGYKLVPSKVRGNGPAEVYKVEGWQGTLGFIHAISGHFCAKCNRLRLTADGKIYPCLHSNTCVDIMTPLKEGATDAELLDIIKEAVNLKPERSSLGAQNHCMNSIGG
ncbi:MAG: GTP 3',8-cyclase MoaA [Clostridia bacterium]|jgi:cyclic pyranopterin phosphate synthase|nr:GTP 3',8-cyclase MoaA [Clostridia bacterium]